MTSERGSLTVSVQRVPCGAGNGRKVTNCHVRQPDVNRYSIQSFKRLKFPDPLHGM